MIDFFSTNVWLIWVIVSILLLILELSSGDFFLLCCAIGTAAGAVAAGCGVSLTLQIIIAVVVAVMSLLLIRPRLLRKLHKPERERASNVDAIIGREGVVKEEIPAGGFGYVGIDGDEWKARVDGDMPVPVGTRVRVLSINSIIITVETV